jgi:hypothetical protein
MERRHFGDNKKNWTHDREKEKNSVNNFILAKKIKKVNKNDRKISRETK